MTKKTLLVTLLVALFLLIALAVPVKAVTVADVQDWTQSDTLHNEDSTIKCEKSTEGNTIVLTYSVADLKLLPTNSDGKRPDGYAWLGVRVNHVPEGAKKFTVNGTEYAILTSEEGDFAEEFVGVKKELLEDVTKLDKDLVYNLEFNFFKENEDVKTAKSLETVNVKVVIKAQGITLYDKENTTQLWDEETYKELVPSAEETTKETPKKKKDNSPKTGVESTAMVATSALAIISLAGIAVSKKA